MRQMANDAADPFSVGARCFHLPLRLANLARGDLFHRARDLLHVLYRSDLRAYFLFTCHDLVRPFLSEGYANSLEARRDCVIVIAALVDRLKHIPVIRTSEVM